MEEKDEEADVELYFLQDLIGACEEVIALYI
mgnify:CR=1 FL=1